MLLGVPAPAAQCGGGGEADVAPELDVPELQGSFTGYALPYLSRTLVAVVLLPSYQCFSSALVSSFASRSCFGFMLFFFTFSSLGVHFQLKFVIAHEW